MHTKKQKINLKHQTHYEDHANARCNVAVILNDKVVTQIGHRFGASSRTFTNCVNHCYSLRCLSSLLSLPRTKKKQILKAFSTK